jgi:hypothetical protein
VNPQARRSFSVRVRVPHRDVSDLYTSTPGADGLVGLSVNGTPVTLREEKGYAVITRTWRPGDRIEFEVPMRVQQVRAIEEVEATRGKVALRYGPLVYNIEKVDVGGDVTTKALSPDAPFTTEWRGDLLNGVVVVRGAFADGSPLLAIPNYARMNREPAPPPRPATPPANPPSGSGPPPRPAPLPVVSLVWINEQR